MGQHTHRIQAGEPGSSNPDGRRQLARRTARARGETPFDFNQYNHKVRGGLDAEISTSNHLLFRNIGILKEILILPVSRFLIVSRI